MIDELIKDARERMRKSVESISHEFASVRTGRASPALLDRVVVDYYGAQTPLKQLATISAPEARLVTVQPYDATSIKAIEKAIMESDLGLTPSSDGKLIRLSVPELTQERRLQMVKVVHGIAEEGRISIRNVRRDVMQDLRELKSAGDVGSDDEHRAEGDVQKLTDEWIGELDVLMKAKEADVLEV
ncbi:MAG: ribosome recycling factor [Actinomycetota bacterium]